MSKNRRDSKGRVLRVGESQRSDGRYEYKYTDALGERHTVYSWRLVETDKMPYGKRADIPLRTAIKQIERDLDDGIRSDIANKKTVNELYDDFMEMRTDLKERTRCNYICLYNKHVRPKIGMKPIGSIKYTDIKKFYLSLHDTSGLKISTIQSINSILLQMFDGASRDSLIRKNPVDGVMKELTRRIDDDRKERKALTLEQQSRLIDYIVNDKRYNKYAVIFTVLLGTGMRIGEMLGLRWCDVDFEKGIISVTHSLSYKSTEHGGYQYSINEPKTKAGIREIPMFQDVAAALMKEKSKKRNKSEKPFKIGAYSGFIFLNSSGKVYTPAAIYDKIQFIVDGYNKTEEAASKEEKRDPIFIPKISPHIFRHTFCTRLCELEQNIKVVQDVMGHRNVRTTLNTYSHATKDAKLASFKAIDGQIKLA